MIAINMLGLENYSAKQNISPNVSDEINMVGRMYKLNHSVHQFHKRCIFTWLRWKALCPICRTWACSSASQFPNWIRNFGMECSVSFFSTVSKVNFKIDDIYSIFSRVGDIYSLVLYCDYCLKGAGLRLNNSIL